MDTHTLYSAELNASALLYSAELSRTECLSMSIPIHSLPDWFWGKGSMKLTTSIFSGNRDCVMVISEVGREHEGMWKCTLIGPGVKAQNHFFELKLTNLQDCTWGNWQPWSSCSKSCGRGQRSRRRRKSQPATGGGRECLEDTTEAELCNNQDCKTQEVVSGPSTGKYTFGSIL